MIRSLEKADGLLLAYQENDYTQDLSAQLIFGGIGASGSLPVTINKMYSLISDLNNCEISECNTFGKWYVIRIPGEKN